MATYEQAIQALRNADASGNVEDAKRLAIIANSLKPEVAPQQEESTYLGRIGEELSGRAQKFGEFVGRQVDKGSIMQGVPAVVSNAIGQTAGAIGDIATESLSTAISQMTPESVKTYLKDKIQPILSTKIGKLGILALEKGGKFKDKFVATYPDAAMALNSATNIVGISGVKKLSDIAGKKITTEIDDIVSRALPEPGQPFPKVEVPTQPISQAAKVTDNIDKVIKYSFEKGIKPSVQGKKSFDAIGNYYDKAKDAVISVINRTDKLPTTVEEFSQSIGKVKKGIWDEVSASTQQATKSGIQVDLNNVINNMERSAKDLLTSPNSNESDRLLKLARNWKEKYPDLKATPTQIEEELSKYNAASQAWWKNPNPNDISSALSNEGIASDLRESLFNSIPNSEAYKTLRKEYGSLLSVERDITHRAIVEGRKNVKGFFDLVDMWGTGELAGGLVSMNPAMIVKGGVHKAITSTTKKINNPNTYIKNMFRKVENDLVKSKQIQPRNRYISREKK